MKNNLVYISIDKLHPHPDNPRKELGDLTELSDSIKANGVMQNLTVVPKSKDEYTIVIGHRRTAAAKLAGLTELPCIIANLTPREQILIMMTENMQRSDLTVYEQATCMQTMMDLGESVESISEQTGFSKTTVRRRLDMAKLDKGKLKEVSQRQLSLTDFDELAKLDDIKKRNELLPFMGTSEFAYRLKSAVKIQEFEKKKKPAVKQLKKLDAQELKNSCDTWNGKYEKIRSVNLDKWDTESPLVAKKENRSLFYFFKEYNEELELYVKAKKSVQPKKSAEEKRREEAIAEARERANALSELTYEREVSLWKNSR